MILEILALKLENRKASKLEVEQHVQMHGKRIREDTESWDQEGWVE